MAEFEYPITCEKCPTQLGVVSFEEEPSQEKLQLALAGYLCEACSGLLTAEGESGGEV